MELLLKFFIADGLQHRFVILIYQNNYTLPRLFASTLNDTGKAQGKGCFRRTGAVLAFPIFKIIIQYFIQTFQRVIVLNIKIEMQYRMLYPILFQLFHSQSFKQFLFPLEISLQGRNEQTLSKTARTTQEVITSGLDHLIHQCRLINIEITVITNLFEILNADRINFIAHNLCFYKLTPVTCLAKIYIFNRTPSHARLKDSFPQATITSNFPYNKV